MKLRTSADGRDARLRLTDWLAVVREASWLTPNRSIAYARILLVLTLILAAAWSALSAGGVDRLGRPLGTDFLSFWSASRLSLGGHPAWVYDVARHWRMERSVFPASKLGYEAFFYPPTYLLVCLPLALLPYLPALAAWLLVTGYACWRAVKAFLRPLGAGLAAPMLAFPAVLANLGHGQNAFLITALFAAGAATMEARPLLAGALLGALSFKPHLAVFIPVGLLAASRWRALLGAGLSALALAGVATLAFGPSIWLAFLRVSPLASRALTEGWVVPSRMQSAFAAVRVLHGSLALAVAVQAVVSIAACATLLVLACRRPRLDGRALGAVVVSATLAASPFLLDYDLMLLAVPMAWLLREAARDGFRPWEKIILFVAFVAPLVSRSLAASLGLPIAPAVLIVLLWAVARRAADGARLAGVWRLDGDYLADGGLGRS